MISTSSTAGNSPCCHAHHRRNEPACRHYWTNAWNRKYAKSGNQPTSSSNDGSYTRPGGRALSCIGFIRVTIASDNADVR